MNKQTYIVVGLGNPEAKYFNTYHNAGFCVVENIVKGLGEKFKKKGNLEYCKVGNVVYIKPLTYMNRSGEAVVWAMKMFNSKPENIIVAYDDVAIEKGALRVRLGGSAGGQNGIKNILQHLDNQDFFRVRIGIKPEHQIDNLFNYVLSRMKNKEELAFDKAAECIEVILNNLQTKTLEQTLAETQQVFNAKK